MKKYIGDEGAGDLLATKGKVKPVGLLTGKKPAQKLGFVKAAGLPRKAKM